MTKILPFTWGLFWDACILKTVEDELIQKIVTWLELYNNESKITTLLNK